MAQEVTAIFSDFSQKTYATREKAVEAGCLYIMGDWAPKRTGWKNGSRVIQVSQFYSPDGSVVETLQERGWTLHDVVLPSWGCVIAHTIVDPLGEIRRTSMTGTDGQGAGEQMKRLTQKLRELSVYNSWMEYDLSQNIRQLTEENERLRARIRELEDGGGHSMVDASESASNPDASK